MTTESNYPPKSLFARIVNWLQTKVAPALAICQQELQQARQDIARLHGDLDDMAIIIEGKDRQILVSAEALATAHSEAARQRRTAAMLKQALDNERRLFKQQSTELTDARKNRKRR